MAWLHVLVVVVRTPCQPPQPCARTAPCLPDCYTHDDLLERFVAMRDALNATGRPIVYSLCQWGVMEAHLWGPQASAGRGARAALRGAAPGSRRGGQPGWGPCA